MKEHRYTYINFAIRVKCDTLRAGLTNSQIEKMKSKFIKVGIGKSKNRNVSVFV